MRRGRAAGAKLELGWGMVMRAVRAGTRVASRRVNFLDATEEEIFELVRTMVNELTIMSCFLVLPPEQKKVVQASITSFGAYLGVDRRRH